MKFFVEIDGKATGPHDISQLVSLLERRIISDASMTTPDQDPPQWKKLDEYLPSVTRAASFGAPLRVRLAGDTAVKVSDIDAPFKKMVILMLRWQVAAIIAALIIGCVVGIVYSIITGLFYGYINP